MSAAPAAKICGLTRREDAEVAAAAGARYGGVILAPGGKRTISAEAAASIFDGLPLRRVGVFVDASAGEMARDAEAAGLDVLQLHGTEPADLVRALRAEGRWEIWKAVRPRDAAEFREAVSVFGAAADGLLLDGWSPDAPGGTGASFPWEEIAALRSLLPPGVRLIVAGGLNPANVGRAVALLDPDVVDVSSGVELAPGIKDPAAVPEFVDAARRGIVDMEART